VRRRTCCGIGVVVEHPCFLRWGGHVRPRHGHPLVRAEVVVTCTSRIRRSSKHLAHTVHAGRSALGDITGITHPVTTRAPSVCLTRLVVPASRCASSPRPARRSITLPVRTSSNSRASKVTSTRELYLTASHKSGPQSRSCHRYGLADLVL